MLKILGKGTNIYIASYNQNATKTAALRAPNQKYTTKSYIQKKMEKWQ
jgi:hypothetical protein